MFKLSVNGDYYKPKLTKGGYDNYYTQYESKGDRILPNHLFRSFLQKYQENLQNKMRGSNFEFDGVNLLYYNFNKISLNRGGSYKEPAKWIKDKKSIINPKNNDHKCFQYVGTLALNYDKIDRNPQRISKIRLFID